VASRGTWFSVGSLVTWAEAGMGTVATQALAEGSYGPLGLALMRTGKSAPEALAALGFRSKPTFSAQRTGDAMPANFDAVQPASLAAPTLGGV
jgi:uncharacterized Ntn-hydrolase superfamily protein